MIREFGLKVNERIRLIEPVDFMDFLKLESHARLVLTDSGGVQEETCIMGVPCVTLRENTERPETIEVGSNILAGTEPDKIMTCAKSMLNKRDVWENPFGDGRASERIVEIIER
jgi:UDP-N-acetylglucosamine 2-epimerase (non-hydrolysing)